MKTDLEKQIENLESQLQDEELEQWAVNEIERQLKNLYHIKFGARRLFPLNSIPAGYGLEE